MKYRRVMFVTDRLVYLQLQKTGCTHIARLLAQICPGEQVQKHNRLPPELRASGRIILGSIRNPWDWYLSLWSYGCGKKGALYKRLVARDLDRNKASASGNLSEKHSPLFAWHNAYGNNDEPEHFRQWLRMVQNPDNRYDLGERYAESPLSLGNGFFTYRYLYLYTGNLETLFSPAITSPENLRAVIENDNLLDFTIRNEQLEDDLVKGLAHCGITLNQDQTNLIYSAPRTNTSLRRKPAADYYDRDTIELVRARDQFLIEKYRYTAPS